MRFGPYVIARCSFVLFLLAVLSGSAALHAQATAPLTAFGPVAVGSSGTQTVTFTFSASTTTLTSVSVVTQGVTGLDFTAGTQTGSGCKAQAYLQNATCTVVVNFTPSTPGIRTGAVLLYDNEATPAVIATGFLNGTGTGPQAVIYPGTQTTLFSGLAGDAFGVLVDTNGDLFLSESANGNVLKESLSAGTYTASTLGSGLGNFSNFAIDGAGNLFMVSSGVMEEKYTPSTATYTQSNPITGVGSYALTIDGSNNLFVANGSQVEEETPSGTSYTGTMISSSLVTLVGLGIDGNNNLYTADAGNSSLSELPYSGGVYASSPTRIASGLGNNNAIAVDASGIVYTVADSSYNTLLRYAPNAGSFTALPQVGSFTRANGVSLDRFGNVYITDDGSQEAVKEINVSTPQTFTFASAVVGSTSTAQTATLTNIGNTSMTLTGLAFSNTNFISGSASTCTSSTVLAAAASCTVAVEFTPTTIGTLTGTLTFTDNALGVAGSTQTVNLSGFGTENLVFSTRPPAALTAGGNAGTVVVSVEESGGTVDTTQTPSVTLTVTGPSSYRQTYGPATAAGGVVSFNTSAAALTTTGTYSYAVTTTASNLNLPTAASETVVASTATTITVTPASTTAYVGTYYTDNITVSAYDQYNNLATNYSGTIALTSTDAAATLPANFTLTSGTATKPVSFGTAGTQTVTATDTVRSSLTATSVAITVLTVPNYVINNSAGDTSGTCTNQNATGATPDSKCTIYAALAAVTALNNTSLTSYVPTITFAPALTASGPLTITMLQAVSVTGNVWLIGPGAVTNSITLSGGNAVTFLASSGTAVTNFTGLTFANFKGAVSTVLTASGTMTFMNDVFTGNNNTTGSSNNGGALGINGNITVTGCTFTNNFSAGGGGALSSTPTALVINNSLFSGNTAAAYGGAYYSYGTGPVTITNSAFVGNKATAGSGGAVYFSTTAPLTVTNGTFNSNTATVDGGAIYTTGLYTITNSSFTGNSISGSSTSYGGAIYGTNGGVNSISSTNFIGNFSSSIGANAIAGALYADHVNLTNVLFSGNYVKSMTTSYGGAVEMTGNYTSTWTGVTLTGNCTAPPSTATLPVPCAGTGASTQNGGAVYQLNSSTINLYNGTVTGNSAKIGGGWYRSSGSLNAYNSVISGNTVSTSYPNVFSNVTSNNSSYIDTTTTSTTCGSLFCSPLLSALGSYGGSTVGATVNGTAYTTPVQTIVPLPGSPLLGGGSLSYVGSPGTLSGGATIDARGYPRTINSKVDIGAVQSNYTLSFVTQPVNTNINTALLPPPTVQLYESGVPFTAGTGGTLTVAAQSGSMFTTSADSTAYNSVAITASGLESVAPYFSTPQSDDALIVSVVNSSATQLTSTTSEPFSIADSSAGSIAFLTPPPPELATGANAGIVKVALTSAGGATNTSVAATTVTIALAGTNYTATTVNGVATFNFATLNSGAAVVLPVGIYSYVASSSYTTDTISAPETVGGYSVWVLNANQTLVKASTAGVAVSTVTPATSAAATYGGVAFDTAGDVYSVNSAANSLLFATGTGGSMSSYLGGGLNAPTAVAIDGAGYVWIANSGNNTVSEFSDARVAMSPAAGYGTADGLGAPSSIVVDGTGGVWVASKTGSSVTHIFGAATPVVTPISSATASGTLGAKP